MERRGTETFKCLLARIIFVLGIIVVMRATNHGGPWLTRSWEPDKNDVSFQEDSNQEATSTRIPVRRPFLALTLVWETLDLRRKCVSVNVEEWIPVRVTSQRPLRQRASRVKEQCNLTQLPLRTFLSPMFQDRNRNHAFAESAESCRCKQNARDGESQWATKEKDNVMSGQCVSGRASARKCNGNLNAGSAPFGGVPLPEPEEIEEGQELSAS